MRFFPGQYYVNQLSRLIARPGYGFLIASLAAADAFLFVLPTDGILVSSTLLKTRKWMIFALWVTFGSVLGHGVICWMTQLKGIEFLLYLHPGLEQEFFWKWSSEFFQDYGVGVVFLFAISPFSALPALVLAILAKLSLPLVIGIFFMGRLGKNLFLAYVASHAPQFLRKLWGIRKELQDAGVDVAKR